MSNRERSVRRRPILLKRVYEKPGPEDGLRVLVDRLWPRGMTRQALSTDLWLKDAAPSPRLRRWYGHDPRRWHDFAQKYRAELAREPGVLRTLGDLRRRGRITLLSAARDTRHSHAVVLRDVLDHD